MKEIELLPILCSIALLLGLLLYLAYPLLATGQTGAVTRPTRQLFERKEQLLGEIVGVLGGGFLFRQLARQMSGLIPVWGIVP